MPSSSAACGVSIVTRAPSIRISPSSARCAPARIFISVDFPAPFSPTSTSTSPAFKVSETSESARTPGKLFPMPRISRSGAKELLRFFRVGLRERSDADLDQIRLFRSGEVAVDRVDRRGADSVGKLYRVAVHVARGDGRARFGRGIVSDDRNLSGHAGSFDGREGAERGIVVDAEDALEIFVRLQHVARVAVGLGARAA